MDPKRHTQRWKNFLTAWRKAPYLKLLLLAAVRAYQRVVSPWLPPACRFSPSCSEYAATAIDRYGAFKGSWLALRRLLRCHPFSAGGYDPVP